MGIDIAADRERKNAAEHKAQLKAGKEAKREQASKEKMARLNARYATDGEKSGKAPVAMPKFICTQCGLKGKPKNITKGSIIVELGLWIFGVVFCWFFLISLIVPIVYSIWRLASRYKGCPDCKTSTMIKTDSPIGRKLVKDSSK